MQRLVSMLQEAEEYVGTVVDGKLTADAHMGRKVSILPTSVVLQPECLILVLTWY